MKAVLSNRIYLEVDTFTKIRLDEALTYAIPDRIPTNPPLIIKNMGNINDKLVSLPIGRTDLIPEGYEIVDKRVLNPVEFPEFKFTLRDSQDEIYQDIEDNAIINASVSWGKTFTGIAIATKLGQKTLVVVHNTGLRNQWVKEIKKTLGFTPGTIGSGKFNTSTPIVVGNTQTLYKRVPQISKEFGLLLMDEMHHVPSATFSRIIDSNYARYKIGLSGTIKRKDGKHVVFTDYFGSKVYKPPKENYMKPQVHIIRSNIWLPGGSDTPWAIKINELTRKQEYRELISVISTAYATKGHKVLMVSDRVAFLEYCADLIGEMAVAVTGQTSEEDRMRLDELMEEKEVLFGTQSIFSEGMSVNALSCLILGTPTNNEPLLEQLIGRVVRVAEGKLQPVVVDIWLKGGIAERQAKTRLGHYMREGYKITYF